MERPRGGILLQTEIKILEGEKGRGWQIRWNGGEEGRQSVKICLHTNSKRNTVEY